jgi:serine protease inhibitor
VKKEFRVHVIKHTGTPHTNVNVDSITTDAISTQTQLLLVNGIYLKGVWLTPFRTEDTAEKTFSPRPEVEITVPIMHHTGKFRAGDDPILGAKWVELPFDVSCKILIIKNSKSNTTTSLQPNLVSHKINNIRTFNVIFRRVRVTIVAVENQKALFSLCVCLKP